MVGALMKRIGVWTVLIGLVASAPLFAETTIGPPKGALVVVGGGGGRKDSVIYRQFLELAGGNDAEIVVIPTASESDDYDTRTSGAKVFRNLGATKITVMHTRDPVLA